MKKNQAIKYFDKLDETILRPTEEAREILVRRGRGEQFNPKKLKRLARHLAMSLISIGTSWKFARSALTSKELQIEKFSLKGRPASPWMRSKRKPKRKWPGN